jgi:hypothetical protein
MGVMCDSIFKLIESGEGECVEFKTASKGVYDGTFETVCSFCNHLGGDILLGFARFSEGEEQMVVYLTLYGEAGMWVRSAKMFFENVTHNGVAQPRFRPV